MKEMSDALSTAKAAKASEALIPTRVLVHTRTTTAQTLHLRVSVVSYLFGRSLVLITYFDWSRYECNHSL